MGFSKTAKKTLAEECPSNLPLQLPTILSQHAAWCCKNWCLKMHKICPVDSSFQGIHCWPELSVATKFRVLRILTLTATGDVSHKMIVSYCFEKKEGCNAVKKVWRLRQTCQHTFRNIFLVYFSIVFVFVSTGGGLSYSIRTLGRGFPLVPRKREHSCERKHMSQTTVESMEAIVDEGSRQKWRPRKRFKILASPSPFLLNCPPKPPRLMRGWHSAALLVTLVVTFGCNAQVVDALRAEKPPPPPHAQSLQSMGSYDESPSAGG